MRSHDSSLYKVPSLYVEGGVGNGLVFSAPRSLPGGEMVEHHLEILGLKLDVATGRDFGRGLSELHRRDDGNPEGILGGDGAQKYFVSFPTLPSLPCS